jgi:phosphoserine phosphatase
VEVRTELLALGPELQVDVAVQRDDVYRGSKRLLCMDVDSTFVKGEFIDELANLCGVKEQVAAITARAMQGELDFEASLRARVELLRGLKVSRARELCDHFDLTPGAADLVTTVKQLGMRVGLVSGGFDFFVETLKSRFGLDFAFANELEIEGDAFTGRVIGTVVDSSRKAQVLKDMSHVFGIRLAQTIAAGDGANDIEMLKAAGLGIAYQAKPKLQEVADTRFNQNDRLDTLLYLMGFDADKLVGVCRG